MVRASLAAHIAFFTDDTKPSRLVCHFPRGVWAIRPSLDATTSFRAAAGSAASRLTGVSPLSSARWTSTPSCPQHRPRARAPRTLPCQAASAAAAAAAMVATSYVLAAAATTCLRWRSHFDSCHHHRRSQRRACRSAPPFARRRRRRAWLESLGTRPTRTSHVSAHLMASFPTGRGLATPAASAAAAAAAAGRACVAMQGASRVAQKPATPALAATADPDGRAGTAGA
ncbi:unnamed protein product, partial [Phaeothamnion confervicola]